MTRMLSPLLPGAPQAHGQSRSRFRVPSASQWQTLRVNSTSPGPSPAAGMGRRWEPGAGSISARRRRRVWGGAGRANRCFASVHSPRGCGSCCGSNSVGSACRSPFAGSLRRHSPGRSAPRSSPRTVRVLPPASLPAQGASLTARAGQATRINDSDQRGRKIAGRGRSPGGPWRAGHVATLPGKRREGWAGMGKNQSRGAGKVRVSGGEEGGTRRVSRSGV